MTASVLDEILARTRERVRRLKLERPLQALRADPLYARTPADFAACLRGRVPAGAGPRVIAEIKFASPSAGRVYPGKADAAEAVRVAGDYLEAGAAALSVLTEPEFFRGDADYLRRVRQAQPGAPLLMKDFFVDEHQLHLARWAGADAVLLIVAALGARLGEFLAAARRLGLSALVEVHTQEELAAAREAGAELIGVNNRDLKTLSTDLAVARRLAHSAGAGRTLIAESGIRAKADLDELSACGYHGFLVGASLMRTGTPGKALERLLRG